ncbi:MAG: glycosyltransferase [Oscillospiraceae bacterium]|nr:glycosyltransferase [Oscillospiraceae bacterium]
MREKISKLVNVYKKYGFVGFMRKLYAYIVANYLDKLSLDVFFRRSYYRAAVRDILSGKFDRVILWRSSFGYNVPLYQRPQHIAHNLARCGCLVLYEVTTMTDKVKTLKKQDDNLYLFNFNNILLNRLLMKELEAVNAPKYIQLYSTDWKLSVKNITDYMSGGFGFIYEYIDHISPELAGTKNLPQNIIDKYDFVMGNKDVYIVVTADLLMHDVIAHRGTERLAFSSNGVDYGFFESFDEDYEFEPEFTEILSKGKPVVCYYGALAKWFDYDLVKEIAQTGRYSVVLFGIKYDESFDENLHGESDIYFMGPRDYKVLKNYARKADILTIPFKINDITRSTSPVKIFEYMALHKPIVTTDMNECRKYSSVLIGKDHKDFIAKLDEALEKRGDTQYIELLDTQARENDWSMKAAAIIDMINPDEQPCDVSRR